MESNFIPKSGEKYISRNERNEVVAVILEHGGVEIRFIRSGGFVVRDFGYKRRNRIADEKIFKAMIKKAHTILSKHPEAPLDSLVRKKWSKSERFRLSYLEKFGIHVLDDGSVVINSNREGKIVHSKHTCIWAAIRAQNKIVEWYLDSGVEPNMSGELYKMQMTYGQIKQITHALNLSRKKENLKKYSLYDEIQIAVANLRRCRNGFKKEIVRQLVAIGDGRDSMGRYNSGACLARLVASRDNTMRRKKQINYNRTRAIKRRQALIIELSELKLHIAMASHKIGETLDKYKFEKRIPDTEIYKILFTLQSVWANPYREIAQLAMKKIKENSKSKQREGLRLARSILKAPLR